MNISDHTPQTAQTQQITALKSRLDTLQAYITQACDHVAQGIPVRLDGMDQTAQDLCAEIESLPPPMGRCLIEPMGKIITQLETLAEHLRKNHPAS